jgi:hypothetical protein
MDTIEALKNQHEHLEDLFDGVTRATDVPTRRHRLEELRSELVAHVALEEWLIRRAVAAAPRQAGLDLDWEARLRVERVDLALAAIEASDAMFEARIATLHELLEDRREYEETRLFPKLRHFVRRQVASDVGGAREERSVAMGGA